MSDLYSIETESNAIKHYGKLGMKWGIRHDPTKALEKSAKKATKLDNKRVKYQLKTAKVQARNVKKIQKAQNKFYGAISPDGYDAKQANKASKKIKKLNKKQAKLNLTTAKYSKAYNKWEKSMAKNFKKVSINSIDQTNIDVGKKYLYMLKDYQIE